jgi:uncharacterized protein (DUF427 family)
MSFVKTISHTLSFYRMENEANTPFPEKESVWDYPRPPVVEPFPGHIQVEFNGKIIADTRRSYRMLETSHPPVYYLPKEDFLGGVLKANSNKSYCEYKGIARYFDIAANGKVTPHAAWTYHEPVDRYKVIAGYIAVYAHSVDACFVNGEKVQPQEGDFYGGWITSNIAGPFKGAPGTMGW